MFYVGSAAEFRRHHRSLIFEKTLIDNLHLSRFIPEKSPKPTGPLFGTLDDWADAIRDSGRIVGSVRFTPGLSYRSQFNLIPFLTKNTVPEGINTLSVLS